MARKGIRFFSITGYIKDTEEIFDGKIVCVEKHLNRNDIHQEDDILLFGVTENELKKAIRLRENSKYPFVVRHYTPVL